MITLGKNLAFSIIAALAAASSAQARPDATKMTCARAELTVRQAGNIVMSTGQWTYAMFYSRETNCPISTQRHPAWIPTRDVAQCFVGYTCEMDN